MSLGKCAHILPAFLKSMQVDTSVAVLWEKTQPPNNEFYSNRS